MNENPYAPPAHSPGEAEQFRERGPRPIGISLLSMLFLGTGLMLSVFPLVLGFNSGSGSGPGVGGLKGLLGMAVLVLVAAGVIAVARGLWIGAGWGWKLGAFMFAFGIISNTSAWISVLAWPELFENSRRGAEGALAKHGTRGFFHALFLWYMFRWSVLEYFDLIEMSVLKAAAVLLGLSLLLYLASSSFFRFLILGL
ncbi:MAG: hypothetical protein AAGM22_12685 [Acidobacteriota bacterium]